jgi:hypothetical protein
MLESVLAAIAAGVEDSGREHLYVAAGRAWFFERSDAERGTGREQGMESAISAFGPRHPWVLLLPSALSRWGASSTRHDLVYATIEGLSATEGEHSPLLLPLLMALQGSEHWGRHAARATRLVEHHFSDDAPPTSDEPWGRTVFAGAQSLATLRGHAAQVLLRDGDVTEALALLDTIGHRHDGSPDARATALARLALALSTQAVDARKERYGPAIYTPLEEALQDAAREAIVLRADAPAVKRIDLLRYLWESCVRCGHEDALEGLRSELEAIAASDDARLAKTASKLLKTAPGR